MTYRPRKHRDPIKPAPKKAAAKKTAPPKATPRKSQVQKEAERLLIETDAAKNTRYTNQVIHELFVKFTPRVRDMAFVNQHAPFESNVYNGLGVGESFVHSLIQLAWTIYPDTLRSSYHGKNVEMRAPQGWLPMEFLPLAESTKYTGGIVMLTMDRRDSRPDIFDELLTLPMIMGVRAVSYTNLLLALNLHELSQDTDRSVEEQDLLERFCGYYMGRIAAFGLIFRCGFISMSDEQNLDAEEAMFKHVDERFQTMLNIADAKDARNNPDLERFEEALIQTTGYGQIGSYVRMGFIDTMAFFDDLTTKHPELLTEPLDSLTHPGSKINLTTEDDGLVVRVNYKATSGQRKTVTEFVRPVDDAVELDFVPEKVTLTKPKTTKEKTMSQSTASARTVTRLPRSIPLSQGAGRPAKDYQKATFAEDVKDFGTRSLARTETQLRRGVRTVKNVALETVHNKKRLAIIGGVAVAVVGGVMLYNYLNGDNNLGDA